MVYAGNLGRFQNIPRIAEVMAYFDGDPRVSFDIVGDGPLGPWLRRFAEANALRNVRFHGYVAPDRLATMLRQDFDVGIVSLHPGVIRNAYPSKTLSYLRNGLPVLALVETDSQLTQTLRSVRGRTFGRPDPARRGRDRHRGSAGRPGRRGGDGGAGPVDVRSRVQPGLDSSGSGATSSAICSPRMPDRSPRPRR